MSRPAYIHISLPVFQSNRKHGTAKPCLIADIKAGTPKTYAHRLDIAGGLVSVHFLMDDPRKLWAQTMLPVTLYDFEGRLFAFLTDKTEITVSRSAILNNRGYSKGRGGPAVREMASTLRPVLTVTNNGETYEAYSATLGNVARFTYSPLKPLSCGAKVYIETQEEITA